jgi:hypothetical protein
MIAELLAGKWLCWQIMKMSPMGLLTANEIEMVSPALLRAIRSTHS